MRLVSVSNRFCSGCFSFTPTALLHIADIWRYVGLLFIFAIVVLRGSLFRVQEQCSRGSSNICIKSVRVYKVPFRISHSSQIALVLNYEQKNANIDYRKNSKGCGNKNSGIDVLSK